jgi:carboxyl-terminal processing protease
MNRERLAWIVSVALLVILAFQLPGSMAQRDDDYDWVRTLVEVHRQVLNNYVEPVDDTQLRDKAVQGMLSELDPFTNYIPPARTEEFDKMLSGTFRGVGISLDARDGKVIVETPIDDTPAERAGILSGDVITKVNDESITGLPLDEVVKRVTGKEGTQVKLTIQRDAQELQFLLTRQEIELPTVKGYTRNKDSSWNYYISENPKIAYIRISQFDTNTFSDVKRALVGVPASPGVTAQTGLLDSGMKGLILDLRFNPGGQLEQAISIVNLFVDKGSKIVTVRGRNRPEEVKLATGEGELPKFPMVVLVNDQSASAAEIVSGSLKDNKRALIIGQRSYGKGSVQEVIPLDDRSSGELKLTVAYYYLPSGRLVHRKKGATDWGVEPQIIVPVDEEGEVAIHEHLLSEERIRGASTRPAAAATTSLVDPQLEQAVTTMVGFIYLDNTRPVITTQPADTQP